MTERDIDTPPDDDELTPITVWFGRLNATIDRECVWSCDDAGLLARLQVFNRDAFERSGAADAGGYAYFWCAGSAEHTLGGRLTDAPDAAVPNFNRTDRVD